MKIQFSLPKNKNFFNRYATLIPTIYKLGFLAQIVSAVTESFVIYIMTYNRIAELSPTLAPLAATVAALIGTAFIEIGLRKFIPYTVRCFIYKRWQGLDMAMSIFIISVCLGLLYTSGSLSFIGSKESIQEIANAPVLLRADSINQIFQLEKIETTQSYQKDSAAITEQYRLKADAVSLRFEKLKVIEDHQLKTYQRRAQREKKNYHSRIESTTRKINQIEADRANELAVIELSRFNDLSELRQNKKERLNTASQDHQASIASISSTNTETINTTKAKTAKHGNLLAWFTIICLFILVLSITLNEIYHKGSKIEEIALPTQYYFSQSIGSELINMISGKANYLIRNKIGQLAASTPAPPLPAAPPILYKLEGLKRTPLEVRIKDNNPKQQYIEIVGPQIQGIGNVQEDSAPFSISPVDEALQKEILDLTQRAIELAKNKLIEESKKVQLKADQVIKAYLGEAASTENIDQLRGQIIGYLEGANENPFKHHHRRSIGFERSNKKEPVSSVVTDSYDKYTIEHKLENSDKIVRYNLQQVNAKISSYASRVSEGFNKLNKAKKKADPILISKVGNGLENRQNKLNYWIKKREELIDKQSYTE